MNSKQNRQRKKGNREECFENKIKEEKQRKRDCFKGFFWKEASFTVEAALVVPVCFLVLLALCCLFQFLIKQNTIQNSLFNAVETYNVQGKEIVSAKSFIGERSLLFWEDLPEGKLCYTNTKIDIPFLGSRFAKLNLYEQMIVSDYKGRSMHSETEDDEIVYIAEYGRVYHWDRECTYLRTRIQAITIRQCRDQRNISGAKYYPCEDCCNALEQPEHATVYIANYGTRYHVDGSCSKLKRTVRTVKKSEVSGMSACSKCGSWEQKIEKGENGDD